jgi:hypothetical protein
MNALPPEVDALTRTYLERVDLALPGFVERLYVVGSTALGAWQPPYSDIDTMIVVSGPITADHVSALMDVHATMPAAPKFDGVYLERPAFEAQVADRRVIPFVVNGTFKTDAPCGELTPVVWLVLSRYGIGVRGPAPQDLGVTVDAAALRSYNLDNLRDYWQPLADEIRTKLGPKPGAEPFDPELLAWVMLGPARLHYTLMYDDIVSKAGAAGHVAAHFPAWTELAGRAARFRAGAAVSCTIADLLAAAESIDAIAEESWRTFGHTMSLVDTED